MDPKYIKGKLQQFKNAKTTADRTTILNKIYEDGFNDGRDNLSEEIQQVLNRNGLMGSEYLQKISDLIG